MSDTLVRVAVVRPKLGWEENLARFLLALALTALIGWFVMLIAGTVTPWHLSYWHSVLTLVGLRLVQVTSGWSNWTHPAKATR